MSSIIEQVDSLENKISKLLRRFTKLKQDKVSLEQEVTILKEQHGRFSSEISELTSTCSSLKLANSILGSDQYKRDTKLKINALVREIDQCITHLSE
jgi:predicted  nucleic acid-binding Zn-ribbon protein